MKSTIGASIRPPRSRGSSPARRASVDPPASARSEARWITGPSASGSENGIADFEDVGAVARERHQDLGGAREIGVAGRHVGHQAGPFASRGYGRTPSAIARHQRPPSRAAWTLITSLSPRPDRLTSRIASFGQRRRDPAGVRDRVRRLERRQDPLLAPEPLERRQRRLVVDPACIPRGRSRAATRARARPTRSRGRRRSSA